MNILLNLFIFKLGVKTSSYKILRNEAKESARGGYMDLKAIEVKSSLSNKHNCPPFATINVI
jgi:hypothetical protein